MSLVSATQLGEGDVKSFMRETLQEYYGVNLDDSYNRAVTDAWDSVQSKWQCCAVEDQSWGTYRASEWYKQQPGVEGYDRPLVPPSCCVESHETYLDLERCQMQMTGPPGRAVGEANQALHYRGCYDVAAEEFIELLTDLTGSVPNVLL